MDQYPTSQPKKVLRGGSNIHELGLFAEEQIRKGEMVIEYIGDLISNCETDRREREYRASGIGSTYMFRINRRSVVDGTVNGNLSKFINHSCAVSFPVSPPKQMIEIFRPTAELLRHSVHPVPANLHFRKSQYQGRWGADFRLLASRRKCAEQNSMSLRSNSMPRFFELKWNCFAIPWIYFLWNLLLRVFRFASCFWAFLDLKCKR